MADLANVSGTSRCRYQCRTETARSVPHRSTCERPGSWYSGRCIKTESHSTAHKSAQVARRRQMTVVSWENRAAGKHFREESYRTVAQQDCGSTSETPDAVLCYGGPSLIHKLNRVPIDRSDLRQSCRGTGGRGYFTQKAFEGSTQQCRLYVYLVPFLAACGISKLVRPTMTGYVFRNPLPWNL